MSLESWGIHTFEGWRGADDSLIIRYSENVHFPNSSPHHRGESWWASHLALRCAQGEVGAPAGTQSSGALKSAHLPRPPPLTLPGFPLPRIFPAPLTGTKILSSVTYGCIINEIRICIVLRTSDGALCFYAEAQTQARKRASARRAHARHSSATKRRRVMSHMTISQRRAARLLSCHLGCSGMSWQLIWKVACFVRNV